MSLKFLSKTISNCKCKPRGFISGILTLSSKTFSSTSFNRGAVTQKLLPTASLHTFHIQCRYFIAWLNSVFNRYDPERVKEVGADRACAEWLLRCGAGVRWKNSQKFLKDYNSLPVGASRDQKIVEIDATDSAVMEAGFPHLRGLSELKRIKFRNCKYMSNDAMVLLEMALADSLEILEVSFNGTLTDDGIRRLKNFKELKILHLEHLPGVEEPEKVLETLRHEIPKCKITFPPYTEGASDVE